LLFMRDTSKEEGNPSEYLFNMGCIVVGELLNLKMHSAERLHTEVWIWVHGIASALATSYVDIDYDTISNMLSDVYLGLKGRYENE
ncbi:MAG: TetR/AcrR family transcriptional regulator, partial [Clostridia bacterium]|nr:TetR/AcrR family transcriptional regulator [Clostridia bacterium]